MRAPHGSVTRLRLLMFPYVQPDRASADAAKLGENTAGGQKFRLFFTPESKLPGSQRANGLAVTGVDARVLPGVIFHPK